MSWFSEERKKLYSKALGALYEDVKTASSSLLDTTGKVIVTGYEKIKEGADYLDRRYHDVPDYPESHNNNNHHPNNYYDEQPDISETDDIDGSDDTDDYLVEMGTIYPDILIRLNRNHYNISKIWVLDNDGNRTRIRGKIASYAYVDNIIHRWFEYENKNERGHKWYPTNELYTVHRKSSTRLNPIDNVIFRYGKEGYKPYHYHPLF